MEDKSKNITVFNKKAVLGWSMYDWANSAFATTVMAVFFPIFFKQYWCIDMGVNLSTAILGFANSFAGILVAVSAPVLGAMADRGSAKKGFLFIFALMGIITTSALYFVSKGNWFFAVVIYVMATVGFSGGNTFYDALITGIAPEDKMDSVSAMGFSLGYLGGGVLLALNVFMTRRPEWFGLSSPSEAVRFSFLLVGIWWALFSIPVFLFVHEPKGDNTTTVVNIVMAGLGRIREIIKEISLHRNVFIFLIAYWLYIDGVDTVIRMAIDYGMSIGLEYNHLIVALLITQFVGFPATIGYGIFGRIIGTKRAIFFAIAVYLFVTVWGAFMKNSTEFYVLAVVIGLVQGGIQALSRSFFAKLIPISRSAEYFGFYNMIGKFAVVIGPALMGGVGLLMKGIGLSSIMSTRVSIISISMLLLSGGMLLFFVKEEGGGFTRH